MKTRRILFLAFAVPFLAACATNALSQDQCDETTETTTQPSDAPAIPPGPDLLKYTPEQIEAAYEGREVPEAVAMYLVIAKGGQLDGRGGWFGPAESRFSWPWLAERNRILPDESLAKDQFQGDEAIFSMLDRDHDGSVSGSDLDWSDNNPWVRQSYMIGRMFRRMDPGGDGKLTAEEWQAFFARIAGDGRCHSFGTTSRCPDSAGQWIFSRRYAGKRNPDQRPDGW